MTIAERARPPLKVPMMVPQFADGSVSDAVVHKLRPGVSGDVHVVGMVGPLFTMIPIRSHHWLSQ